MSIYYREYGDKQGPLMIFLHGGGVSGWMWDKQIPYFSRYHCVVPDLPEHGLHQESVPFSIYNSAEAIINLIEDKASGKPVTVIGFSLGAQVLIQILSMKPDLIHYAVINSALVRPMASMKKWLRPSIKLAFPLIKYKSFARLQAKSLYIGEEHFKTYYEESKNIKQAALLRVLEENMSFEIPKEFSEAKSKILVTVGAKEKAIMIKSAKDIVEANTNCFGVIISNIGHGIPLAKPELFNVMVEAWILETGLTNDSKLMEEMEPFTK
ncbi:alpha/beta hydrolase [Oceanobacillus piezotolerans]|uniref:Alpha/beta hydrolase n=1 Tax=Oceanobacillus piezotolerans TaxID=2448030 RepID=A0A498D510_9BACI|nr:alpha/beta hydrolase [Oceanobacillus piezotolerans]RLL43693.1 alpha/beta hydrolase [Oceanobacillus piezotolerans]